MLSQKFNPGKVENYDKFSAEFERWLEHGKEKEILKAHEDDKPFNPLLTRKYLYQIFRNELKRHGQPLSLKVFDPYPNFKKEYSQGIKLTFCTNGRIIKEDKTIIILFPSFNDELAKKGWLRPWREEKEIVAKKNFYWQLWKLFYFEFLRQGIFNDFSKRRKIFEEFWPKLE